MSAELELRWLKIDNLVGAAKGFAEFCKEDIKEQSKTEGFDLDKYQESVKLLISKLDHSSAVNALFTPEIDKNKSEDAESIEVTNHVD